MSGPPPVRTLLRRARLLQPTLPSLSPSLRWWTSPRRARWERTRSRASWTSTGACGTGACGTISAGWLPLGLGAEETLGTVDQYRSTACGTIWPAWVPALRSGTSGGLRNVGCCRRGPRGGGPAAHPQAHQGRRRPGQRRCAPAHPALVPSPPSNCPRIIAPAARRRAAPWTWSSPHPPHPFIRPPMLRSKAARCALDLGFSGVEVHGANGCESGGVMQRGTPGVGPWVLGGARQWRL